MKLDDVKSKTTKGVIVLTFRTIFLQVISAVAFFLLGIFLTPGAIGTFIVVSAAMRVFGLFTDLGLGAALVQKESEPTPAEYSTAFFVQIALVGGVVAMGFVVTPLVASYLNLTQSAVLLYYALLGALMISSFKSIPSVIMERRLDFGRQIIPQIVEVFVFNLVVVYLSYRGFDTLSFAYAVILSAIAGLPCYYLVQNWRPNLIFDRTKLSHLVRFGIFFQGKTVLGVIKDDILTFTVTAIIGPSGVGYWGWAQRWAYSPFRFVVDSVTKVTFPAYARMQENREAVKDALEKTLFAVSMVLFPILVAIAVLSFPAVALVPRYTKWEPALPSLVLLCFQAGLSGISNILVNFLDSHGHVKTTLKLMVFWIVLIWIFTIPATYFYGFTGVAASALTVSLTLPLTMYLVNRHVKINYSRTLLAPAISSGVMAIGMVVTLNALPTSWFSVVIVGVVGGIIYSIIMLILAREKLMAFVLKIIHHFHI